MGNFRLWKQNEMPKRIDDLEPAIIVVMLILFRGGYNEAYHYFNS